VVVTAGYNAAFLTLGAIAAIGFIVFLLAFRVAAGGASLSRSPLPRRSKVAAG